MKLPRRKFFRFAVGAVALPAVSRLARAQAYPSRPVRIVVGFPPGGGTDIAARLIGQWLSERLGQQFVIENRPGAGSNIATEAVVRASADGYTLLLISAAHAINATLYDKLNYNFLRDFAPVAGIIRVPNVMEVNPSLPPKSVSEFIAYGKANPGKVNYASGGNGTAQHLSGELFKMMTGVVMVHVPYRGDALALTDLIGGQVQVMFGSIPPSVEHIRAGKLRALRRRAAPDCLPQFCRRLSQVCSSIFLRRDSRYRCHTRSHSMAKTEMKIAVNETAMIARKVAYFSRPQSWLGGTTASPLRYTPGTDQPLTFLIRSESPSMETCANWRRLSV